METRWRQGGDKGGDVFSVELTGEGSWTRSVLKMNSSRKVMNSSRKVMNSSRKM